MQQENRDYLERNLPGYLQRDINAMMEKKYPWDCLYGELYGSINSAESDGDITKEQAVHLREKYLGTEFSRA